MKSVYGLMVTAGSADEMLWDHGVWETEESAQVYIDTELSHLSGIWIGELKINDAFPEAAEDNSDEMVECSLCGIEYNGEDVNSTDYDEKVCINCEPDYRETLQSAQ